MRPEEGLAFLDIHGRSIRGLAAQHYSSEVIDAWAIPITEANVRGFLKNPEDEIRLIAELDGEPVGLGCLVLKRSELRACYVVPEAARKGVGSAVVREIERIAIGSGVTELHLDASINAEPFYAALGYEVLERHDHVFRSGHRMTDHASSAFNPRTHRLHDDGPRVKELGRFYLDRPAGTPRVRTKAVHPRLEHVGDQAERDLWRHPDCQETLSWRHGYWRWA